MTDQPLKACPVCWTRWCEPNERRCGACSPGGVRNTATKRGAPKPLPENLAGFTDPTTP